jgi:hypothetical protein
VCICFLIAPGVTEYIKLIFTLAKECYAMKLDLLTNATVVEAQPTVSSNNEQLYFLAEYGTSRNYYTYFRLAKVLEE